MPETFSEALLRKITSRKWQAAVVGALSPIAVKVTTGELAWWQALAMSLSVTAVYILVEGWTDVARVASSVSEGVHTIVTAAASDPAEVPAVVPDPPEEETEKVEESP